jgi:hypothetical protein
MRTSTSPGISTGRPLSRTASSPNSSMARVRGFAHTTDKEFFQSVLYAVKSGMH